MSSKLSKLLTWYTGLAALFITISAFLNVRHIKNSTIQILFLPVTLYMFIALTTQIKQKLLVKNNSREDDNITKKSLAVYGAIYLVLLFVGVLSIINSKSANINNIEGKVQTESTPLIFTQTDNEEKELDGATTSGEKVNP